jgi:hypothetical protein
MNGMRSGASDLWDEVSVGDMSGSPRSTKTGIEDKCAADARLDLDQD